MHILLTNDDGIDAPGIAALETAVSKFATVWVVAPDRGYSGCGHQVTNHQTIHVSSMGDRRFKVDGTPADCARLGIRQLVDQIDWVISGVNAGGNLGVDLWMSGTVAAAREATWLGRRAISISQYMRRDRPRDWDKTAALTERVVRKLIESELPVDSHWNVNLPDVDTSVSDIEIVNAHPEPRHLEVDYIKTEDGYRYQGDYRQRPRSKGSDVAVCFDDGNIAVSLVTATAMP